MMYKYILFDLDGTLLDTNKLIIDSFKHTLKAHLSFDADEQELLKYFGEPLLKTLNRYSPEMADAMFNTYIKYNEVNHDNCVIPCEGVSCLIPVLKEMGCTLAVVTSKRKPMVLRGLRLFNLEKYFSEIVSFEDTDKHKPEADPILKALELLGAKNDEAIMVGDSVFDIACAKNAGVKSVFVNWSAAGTHQEVIADPDFCINSIEELINIVK